MNQLWPNAYDSDGRRCFAYNDDPCFFDQSWVHVMADQQSGVLGKIATFVKVAGLMVPEYYDPALYVKEGAEVLATIEKTGPGDITATPDSASPAPLPQLAAALLEESGRRMSEQDQPVPCEDLGDVSPDELMSTMTMLGMKVHPVEYTYVMVKKTFSPDVARDLYDHGESLVGPCPLDSCPEPMDALTFQENFSPKLACALKKHLKGRSMYRAKRSLPIRKTASVINNDGSGSSVSSKFAQGFRDLITSSYYMKAAQAVNVLHLMSEQYEKNASLVVEVQEDPLEPLSGLEPVVAAQARLRGAYGLKV
jgi:hypothetical protein